ncbi:hypothetical protein CAPTEDRAFT_189858 [Capitella teleta]|uniref:Multidrug and toxin extrusion protein n=1 Tax=Capitella teleta TaxID=283909 RepID=R7VBJ1_CAPTE|nr:hypothetical protein CAPTEDRAFT_189858 [Capitella teleta]|eukprot:ELU16173.1 hypothetical protein CAPTEDRAFT_189858 [Capitella teleta]
MDRFHHKCYCKIPTLVHHIYTQHNDGVTVLKIWPNPVMGQFSPVETAFNHLCSLLFERQDSAHVICSTMSSFGPATDVEISNGCYPFGFWNELTELFHLAWPTSLSILFHYLIQPISLMFCGHLGKVQLASAALAISVSALNCEISWLIIELNIRVQFIYISTVSIGRGLAFGGDTFFAQAYCWLFTLMRYLLCQNRVIPNLLICMGSCGVNAILHYGLVYQAQMGLRGSAISLAMTYYLVLILLISYIWGSGVYRETWQGWTWECLDEWGEFARVAVSSIFMTFIFWLCTEVGTFLSGLLSEEDISAFQIGFQVEGFAWMIPLGVGSACTSRIGQYLGANEPLGAVTSCRVALTVQAAISIIIAGACYGLRYYIPIAFTDNPELIDYTGRIMSIVSLFLLLEGFGGVGVGIVRGTGRQTLGVVIIFISYYVVALPVGVPLMFATSLGLAGLWWGYVLGLGIQDLFLMAFVAKVDWCVEAEKAAERAGVSSSPDDSSVNQSENSTSEQSTENTALLGSASTVPLNKGRLLLKRLAILAVFGAILAGAVLCRVFVKVKRPMTELCVPVNDTIQLSPWANISLPLCNETALVKGIWPYYPLWV